MQSMWTVVLFLSSALLCLAQRDSDRYDGKYYHNPNEGRYIPDNSGQYYPDYSGQYQHDGLGGYSDDGTGRYSGQKDPFANNKQNSGSGNLIGANTFQSAQVRPAPRLIKPSESEFLKKAAIPVDFGKSASGVTGTGQYNDQGKWKIIRQTGDIDLDGYHWEYLTENKINAEESGKIFNKGREDEALRAKGFFTYTGPDNVEYHITYTADENGFIPEGEHIPTPPPVPEGILRALEYQRSIGTL